MTQIVRKLRPPEEVLEEAMARVTQKRARRKKQTLAL